ncbi:haloacid dehalogenase superfamily, subfamily IA, variant 3 with third motif having DD or ED [Thiothrix caldifontis]|uniref:Haloacid dehalogenase superfamily, subfamily IA, variant 3 with third motif having DD or ED n=1 Tax=Thiothrix caldifontis TaxID=525918 RepID=A0A1H3YGF6_9GAMM|nr:HAD family hydrolase [Thiothrix caldifontis]SEA10124.1 haloacid dehalogenase superfamily, subfamily IA, variant 3 with third motif having DD or ED [Thiothrix caldifontis]
MPQLTALLFDVDGTLADTERDGHRPAFNKAFAEAGLDWDWTVDLYADLLTVTGGKERIRYFVEKYLPSFTPDEGLAGFAARMHKRKTHFYLEMLQAGEIPLRVGAERLIREARAAGLRLGIATTTTPENVTYLLKATLGEESIGWFECIAAGDIVPKKKPAPDIYVYAMQQMGLQPEECLVFEDSDNGIRSSTAANLQTIVTVNDYTRDHNFSNAVLVVDQFGEADTPFTVLQGDAGTESYATLALLQHVFNQGNRS